MANIKKDKIIQVILPILKPLLKEYLPKIAKWAFGKIPKKFRVYLKIFGVVAIPIYLGGVQVGTWDNQYIEGGCVSTFIPTDVNGAYAITIEGDTLIIIGDTTNVK